MSTFSEQAAARAAIANRKLDSFDIRHKQTVVQRAGLILAERQAQATVESHNEQVSVRAASAVKRSYFGDR